MAILAELPEFCTTFYDKNQTTFLPKTQYDYMRTMRTFLTYLQQTHPYFNDCELTLSAKKKRFNDQYGLRDEIIYQILKETEIRLSELAELNIRDFDLKNHRFYVYRTKQRSTWISMSDELTDLIEKYLEERSAYAFEKDAEAVFLVTIGRYKGARLGVRSIERIVITIRKRQL
ncbi:MULTISPECIES: tyrosine-type recombinase/integrase [Clostridia]|uniref:tyrosine-type recombinase/integrase n=1 Tax=Clostridia TaxID=186801 RepID=UPI000D657E92|nr:MULTISPECIES: tyrosine-type recombinase/integrase [Clostridia]RHV70698.1 hypothetical protein DXB15_05345 [Roseburia sp. OM02-15]